MEGKKKIENLIASLTDAEKDALYRRLWFGYVKEDVLSRAEDTGVIVSKGTAEVIAERYVYHGRYDCDLSYWDNIDNLIDETR